MPVFYDVDLRNAKLREFAFGTPWYVMPLILLMKLLRAPFAGSTDDPPVESLAPFEVGEDALPADVRERFAPLADELARMGFHSPIFHAIAYPLHATRTYWATFLHPSGQAWARLHCRIWSGEGKDRTFLFPMFLSAMDDGSFLVSSAGKPDMIMPESVRMINQVGATAAELWERHQRELVEELPRRAASIRHHEELREAIERHHGELRDYNLRRGVFQPLNEQQQQALAPPAGDVDEVVPATAEDGAVFIELERLQNKKSSWWNTLLVLAISIALFMAAARFGEQWTVMWALVPILLVHELGHYVAMRWFGYRNLKMFFIPFLGAAVSGRHYNVSGWKKAIVALAGPVPSIVLGVGIGLVGLLLGRPLIAGAAVLVLIVNGFNLLPMLPLDGGWVVHTVLMARHPLLDVVFRLAAILALFGLGLAAGDRILLILPIIMLIGLPMSWRVARIAHRLRQRGVTAASPDAQSIPPDTAAIILTELRAKVPMLKSPKLLALNVAQIFETLNARPPGVLASLALLAVHAGSLLLALVLGITLLIGQLGGLREIGALVARRPARTYEPGSTDVWRGPQAPAPRRDDAVTIIATFDRCYAARKAFEALPPQLPPQATLRWFGESLLLTLPGDRVQEHKSWSDRLRQEAGEVQVHTQQAPAWVRVFFIMTNTAEAERLEAEMREYFEVLNFHLLLPPWSAAWQALPEADRLRFRTARRTLRRLQEIPLEDVGDPDNDADMRRLLERIQSEGGDAELLPVWKQWARLEKSFLKMDDGGKPLDRDALRARVAERHRERATLLRRMAERMGPLPLKGDKPQPGSDIEATVTGSVERKGPYLLLEYVTFRQLDEGLPALAEWLARRGGRQIRYGLFGMNDELFLPGDAP